MDLPHGLDTSKSEESALEKLRESIRITDNGEEVSEVVYREIYFSDWR